MAKSCLSNVETMLHATLDAKSVFDAVASRDFCSARLSHGLHPWTIVAVRVRGTDFSIGSLDSLARKVGDGLSNTKLHFRSKEAAR